MAFNTSSYLPPARQLQRESTVVQEQIRKTIDRQHFGKSVRAQLEHKHAQRRQKILVVANRLPTNAKRNSDGQWSFAKASGGLVSSLGGIFQSFEMVWLGWPGADIPEADQQLVAEEAMKQNCYPVFLDQKLIEDYYNGFANNVLWPLLHYIMPPYDKGVNECATSQWEAYRKANEKFVEAILQVYEDDDYVWVHDYHLMLVPKLMRESRPDSNIGWFLHTPFPSAEVYRTLPWRQEIIESLLHSNLLGFHVYDYLRHFLSSCVQLTSLEIAAHSVDATSIGGCNVTCVTVPIGISPEDFSRALHSPEVQDQTKILKDQYGDRKVILGIDRLDYMKGIPHKLMAFDHFLDQHPEQVDKCVLVQLAVPSRRDVPEYQRLMRQVHELVGQICGKHSSLESGTPVIYLDQSMSHNDLVALYSFASVALITSLRDGMNLVSYEFIACHEDANPGVLVLSEFAGAAQSLGAGSIRVNPWNLEDTAQAIYEALTMPEPEKRALHQYAFDYIREHTAQKWAETFLQCLEQASSDCMEITAEVPPLLPFEELLGDWSESKRRLIIIDILECLVPPRKTHASRKRNTQAQLLPQELKEGLENIANSPDTVVVITADKRRETLENTCGKLPVYLAPEGCCICRDLSGEWRPLVEDPGGDSGTNANEEWITGVKEVFDYFKERTPGSYIETSRIGEDQQPFSIRWYWEDTQTDFGSAQSREVLIHLWAGPLVNSEAEVVVGDRSITVRPHNCSRSACLERLLRQEKGEEWLQHVDFLLCFAVVSHRDEDIYESLVNLLGQASPEYDLPHDLLALPPLPETRLEDIASRVSPASSPSLASSHRPTDICLNDLDAGDLVLRNLREVQSEIERGDNVLGTPREVPPEIQPGEEPPPYDWIPPAQKLMKQLQEQPASVAGDDHPPNEEPTHTPVAAEEDASFCACYTLSLGMRKTKAQYMLPHPYLVQNLIRAMADRKPKTASDNS